MLQMLPPTTLCLAATARFLIPVLGRVFERLIYERLLHIALSTNCISALQFAFLPQLGTEDALDYEVHKYKLVPPSQVSRCFKVDISGAFDNARYVITAGTTEQRRTHLPSRYDSSISFRSPQLPDYRGRYRRAPANTRHASRWLFVSIVMAFRQRDNFGSTTSAVMQYAFLS